MIPTMNGRNGGWLYPLVIGVVIGVLVAGLTYRIGPELKDSSSATVPGTDLPAVDGSGVPLPGQSAGPATSAGPGTTGGVPGTGTGATGPGATGGPNAPGAPSGPGGSGGNAPL